MIHDYIWTKNQFYPDKDVNDCKSEEKDRCWKITPATLASDDMNLPLLRAFGKAYVLFYNQPHSEPRVNKIDLVKILISICLLKVLVWTFNLYRNKEREFQAD